MKPLYSFLMFAVLMGLAATSSIHRYRCTEDSIVADMNQALARTLATKQDAYITPDTQSGRFKTGGKEVPITPMQQRLMEMLYHADGHQLGKQQICSELWPKKPDATETLYTLIRRIKLVIARAGLTITTERGKGYRLTRISKNNIPK